MWRLRPTLVSASSEPRIAPAPGLRPTGCRPPRRSAREIGPTGHGPSSWRQGGSCRTAVSAPSRSDRSEIASSSSDRGLTATALNCLRPSRESPPARYVKTVGQPLRCGLPRSARGDHSMSKPNRRSVLMGVASLAGVAFVPFRAMAQEVDASEIYGPVTGEPFPVRGIDLSRVNPRFLRTLVDYPTDPLSRHRWRTGDPLRRRCRPPGVSMVRDGIHRSETRMAGLVSPQGDVRPAARDRQ